MTRSRLPLLAAAASLEALLLAGPAGAQVHMFEAAPPIEMLRSIMVPESRPGLTRRIILTNPELFRETIASNGERRPARSASASTSP